MATALRPHHYVLIVTWYSSPRMKYVEATAFLAVSFCGSPYSMVPSFSRRIGRRSGFTESAYC